MNFMRNVMEAIVRSGGHTVPMTEERLREIQQQQLKAQEKLGTNGFGKVLMGMQKAQSQLQMPTPPTPPVNSENPEDQQKYNQALLAYNQQFQQYHTNMIQAMFQRFAMMQQGLDQSLFRIQQNQSSSSSSSSNSAYSSVEPDLGSIIGTDSVDV